SATSSFIAYVPPLDRGTTIDGPWAGENRVHRPGGRVTRLWPGGPPDDGVRDPGTAQAARGHRGGKPRPAPGLGRELDAARVRPGEGGTDPRRARRRAVVR